MRYAYMNRKRSEATEQERDRRINGKETLYGQDRNKKRVQDS